MTPPRDGDDSDGYRSWQLAIAIHREQEVRAGNDPPSPGNAQEQKWAREGEVSNEQLDTVKGARW